MFERFLQPAPAPTTAMERAGAECDRTLEVRDRALAAISASFETVS